MEVNYELCTTCEKNMNDALDAAGLSTLTVEQMIEVKAQVAFVVALEAAQEGHIVKRINDEYGFTVRMLDNTGCGEETPHYCVVNAEGKTVAIKGDFSIAEVTATDFIIVK